MRRSKLATAAVVGLILEVALTAASPASEAGAAPPNRPDITWTAVTFAALPGWRDDDHGAAFATFLRSCEQLLSRGEPAKFTKGSGRLELADALVTDASPLVARVFVNRVWKEHFGIGLVETPSDFGKQGEAPSHPDLLDDLASRFIAGGWSLKWLHREIMLSAAYQQASGPAPNGDAGYRYYSKFPRRRLDIEAWRDALLFVTGTLDLKMGGPPAELNLPANHRRTIYGTVRRRELTDILRLHDFQLLLVFSQFTYLGSESL